MGDHQSEQNRFAVAAAARRNASLSEFGVHPTGWLPDRQLPPLRRVGGPARHSPGLIPLPPPRQVLEIGRPPLPPVGARDLDAGITEAFRLAFTTPAAPSNEAIGEQPALVVQAPAEAKAPEVENVGANSNLSLAPPVEAPPPKPTSNGPGNLALTPSQRDWLDLITQELAAAGH